MNYFENLLPDNPRVKEALRDKYATEDITAFSLLAEIGRDCVGSLQILLPDEEPQGLNTIDALPLSDSEIEARIRQIRNNSIVIHEGSEEFRLSIAGAQAKTALLFHNSQWLEPHGTTPSNTILKFQLRPTGAESPLVRAVEIEYFTMEVMRELGFPVAECAIHQFGEQTVLTVTRFDRQYSEDGRWIRRLPQEDFCQVFGIAPTNKYEVHGGPGVVRIMEFLRSSTSAEANRNHFFDTQVAFFVLGALDGHAKNFSIFLGPGSRFRLTPLYDILSYHALEGRGEDRIEFKNMSLSMTLPSNPPKKKLSNLTWQDWEVIGKRLGIVRPRERVEQIITAMPTALDAVTARLPANFPEAIASRIVDGTRKMLQR